MKQTTVRALCGRHWSINQNDNGTLDRDEVNTLLLQEIRDAVVSMATILSCPNAIDIPNILCRIESRLVAVEKNTTKRRPRRGRSTR